MAEAQGSFTVGAAGDYASWDLAIADIDATLTGDLTFTQTGVVAVEGGTISPKAVALAGFTLTCASDTPHKGNPNAGHLASLAGASDNKGIIKLEGTGTGKLVIRDLNLRRTGTPTSSILIDIITKGPDVDIRDCIVISTASSGSASGIKTIADSGASGSTDIYTWNCVASGFSGTGIQSGTGYSALAVMENCTAFNNDTNISGGVAAGTMINCVAFDHAGTADFANHGSQTGTNNASEDATAADVSWSSGSGNITSIVPGTEFVSISTSSVDMVRVKTGGSLDDGGASTTIAANTAGIRTNARPGTDSNYSIGADEFIIVPTVTLATPNDGVAAGGTPVTVTGTEFVTGATIKFGGVSATSVVFVGATELTCVTPAGTGVVDVVVTNTDSGFGTLAGGFSYLGGVATQKAVTVSTRLGEGSSGIVRSSPGLGDIMNKVADNLAFIKEASQQDNFAEFKFAMADLDALAADPLPQFGSYPKELGTVQVPERFGEAMRLSRAEASRLQGLLEVMTRVSEILVGMKVASQKTDFAAFKTSMATLAAVLKSNDSRI